MCYGHLPVRISGCNLPMISVTHLSRTAFQENTPSRRSDVRGTLHAPSQNTRNADYYTQLDSTSAREVVAAIQRLAKAEGMIVIATIHQPSVETFSLFNEVLFLADGKTCYSGSPDGLDRFFERWGHPIGRFVCIIIQTSSSLADISGRRTPQTTR